jgi:hypothetical protein
LVCWHFNGYVLQCALNKGVGVVLQSQMILSV